MSKLCFKFLSFWSSSRFKLLHFKLLIHKFEFSFVLQSGLKVRHRKSLAFRMMITIKWSISKTQPCFWPDHWEFWSRPGRNSLGKHV